MQITQQQEKKLKKIIALGEQGLPALLEYLFEIEEKLDTEMPAIMEVINRITAETDDSALLSKIEEAVDKIRPEPISDEHLRSLITPLIPEPLNGKDYILTEDDKKQIANKIVVPKPTPDKIIEKIETIKIEQPIEIIKEIAVITDEEITARGEAIRDGLELLQDDDRLDKKAIKGLDDYDEVARLAKTTRTFTGGANRNLQQVTDMGAETTNKITVPAVQFDTTATPQPNAEGLLQWNATDGTLDLGMDGGDITQQIGQEMFTKVRNQSGSTILNGKAVYFSGRLGNRPLISLALGDAEVTSRVAGITTQDITSPSDGFITTVGYVRGIKTDYTGAGIWGTTWVEGDILYVSKTVAGQITNVEPAIPHHSDIIGSVGIIHSSLGSILINIERHKALEGLSDVNGTVPIEGSILSYHDGVGEQYFDFTANITDFLSKTITISNPTVMTSTPIISVPNASTITSIKVLCIGGTSITGNVDVLDNNGNSPTPVNADVTAVAGTESTYTSFASPTVASGYYIGWHTTSISGVPSKVIISVTYTLN